LREHRTPRPAVEDRVEDRLDLARRGAAHPEDVGDRPLPRLGEVVPEGSDSGRAGGARGLARRRPASLEEGTRGRYVDYPHELVHGGLPRPGAV
jgi:hypothetical protein